MDDSQKSGPSQSLPPEKIFVIGVGVLLVVGIIIYGITKINTSDVAYKKLDLSMKKEKKEVEGVNVYGPYGKPSTLPTIKPTDVTPTPSPTFPPEATATSTPQPTATPTVTPTTTPTPTSSPSATPSPTFSPTPSQ